MTLSPVRFGAFHSLIGSPQEIEKAVYGLQVLAAKEQRVTGRKVPFEVFQLSEYQGVRLGDADDIQISWVLTKSHARKFKQIKPKLEAFLKLNQAFQLLGQTQQNMLRRSQKAYSESESRELQKIEAEIPETLPMPAALSFYQELQDKTGEYMHPAENVVKYLAEGRYDLDKGSIFEPPAWFKRLMKKRQREQAKAANP